MRPLWDTEVGDEWVDAGRIWRRALILPFAGLVGFALLARTDALILLAMMAGLAAISGLRAVSRRKAAISVIALSEGHPWHDAETTGDTTVHVLDIDGEWQDLPTSARLVPTEDPLLGRLLLRDGDADGKVLVRWSGDADRQLITLINMAQALAEAQDRDTDAMDPIELARQREETAEGLLEREWESTDEGALGYEPGAILRALKRQSDGE